MKNGLSRTAESKNGTLSAVFFKVGGVDCSRLIRVAMAPQRCQHPLLRPHTAAPRENTVGNQVHDYFYRATCGSIVCCGGGASCNVIHAVKGDFARPFSAVFRAGLQGHDPATRFHVEDGVRQNGCLNGIFSKRTSRVPIVFRHGSTTGKRRSLFCARQKQPSTFLDVTGLAKRYSHRTR